MPIDFLVQHAEAHLATNPGETLEITVKNKKERDDILKNLDPDTYKVVSGKVGGGYKLKISAKV